MNTLTYNGYTGSVEFSEEDNVFFGKLEGINARKTVLRQVGHRCYTRNSQHNSTFGAQKRHIYQRFC